MTYKCRVSEISVIECVNFINNEIGAIMCGNIMEVAKYWIRQECLNQVEMPIIARNLASAMCYHLCN